MINSKDKAFQRYYEVSYRELTYFLGITESHSAKEQIERSLRRINKRPVIINPRLTAYWFASFEWKENGMIEFEFSDKLQQHLIGLKNRFTKYQLYQVLPLRSVHSIRLYELCKQYQVIKERTFPLEVLKDLIGLKRDSYKKWHDFKKRILEPAKQEVYTTTDIGFNYYPLSKEKGKAITHVRFTIFHSDKQKAKQWLEKQEQLHRLAETKRAAYIIPSDSLNTPAFDQAYKNFLDNRHRLPEGITFETYVDQLGYKIIHNKKGKDLQAVGQQRLIN